MDIFFTVGYLGGQPYYQPNYAWYSILAIIAGLFLFLVLLLLPVYFIYLLISRPLKKIERAKNLLDIIEFSENRGIPPEQAFTGIRQMGRHRLGKKFDSFAFYVDNGMDLFSSLDAVPGMLPREVKCTLSIGRKIGNLRSVLPLCRELLNRHISRTRGILNYLVMPSLFYIFILAGITVFVIPKFNKIYAEMLDGQQLPRLTTFIFDSIPWLALVGNLQLWLMLLFIFLFSFGADFSRTFVLEYIASHIFYYLVPWRRKRIQQNFAVSLATLLDYQVPEQEALLMAAESTGNYVMTRFAKEGVAMMQQGTGLIKVLSAEFDKSGELAWRFKNSFMAQKQKPNFVQAVAGWGSWLNACAFRQEQMAAHAISTLLILISALFIGLVAVGMFLPLIQIVSSSIWCS